MVRECYQSSISIDGDIDDFGSLKNTVSAILNRGYFRRTGYDDNYNPQYEVVVYLPVDPRDRNIFNKHGQTLGTFLHDRLTALKEDIEKVSCESDLKKKCKILASDIFGDDFPIPKDSDKSDNRKFKEAGFIASPQGA
jgi:hypothetical protein